VNKLDYKYNGEPGRSGTKLSNEDLVIKKAMANAKASIEIEGLNVPNESEELVYQRLKGIISEKEFLKRVLEIVTKKDGC
jgi:hypothetical protein